MPPADVAVRAWLKDRGLVERKHAEIFASRPRRFEYFQSYDDPPRPLPDLTPERLRPLEAHLDGVFASKGRGRGVRVLAYPRDGDCLFMVRHGDARRREGALDGTEETSVLYRPLRFDVVGYDARNGTVRVYARSGWETSLYRGAFGQHLFAIGYTLNQWDALRRYTEHGWVNVDNNAAERALKRVVIGRKNWQFASRGRTKPVRLWMLIASAEAQGIDPQAYLRSVLAKIG